MSIEWPGFCLDSSLLDRLPAIVSAIGLSSDKEKDDIVPEAIVYRIGYNHSRFEVILRTSTGNRQCYDLLLLPSPVKNVMQNTELRNYWGHFERAMLASGAVAHGDCRYVIWVGVGGLEAIRNLICSAGYVEVSLDAGVVSGICFGRHPIASNPEIFVSRCMPLRASAAERWHYVAFTIESWRERNTNVDQMLRRAGMAKLP